MSTVTIGGLSAAVESELKLYSKEITENLKKQTIKTAKELVTKTKVAAPVGKSKKHFKSAIAYKVTKETANDCECTWYVRPNKTGLTHLLEHGHAKKGGGSTRATHFVENAWIEVRSNYEKAVERIIQNAG